MPPSAARQSLLAFATTGWRKLRPVLILGSCAAVVVLSWFLLTVYVWFNFHEVVPGEVYRSAQPSPAFLETVARDKNLRSIIKLNTTKEEGWSAQEIDLAKRLGLEMRYINIGVAQLPSRQDLVDLVYAIDSAPRPLLIHCKTGADRTGVVAGLARMREGDSFDAAFSSQLKLRYMHVGHLGEAVEDLIAQYRADRAADRLPTGGWDEFRQYVLTDYYPAFYNAEIEPAVAQLRGDPGQTVRLKVKVTNRSRHPWPADRDHPLRLALGRYPTFLARVGVPALAAQESVTLRVRVTIPTDMAPGTYHLPFDIAHGTLTWFEERGSSVSPITVTVNEPPLADASELKSTDP